MKYNYQYNKNRMVTKALNANYYKTRIFFIYILFFLFGCKSIQNTKVTQIEDSITTLKIRFIGEQIIPEDKQFMETRVGGLSSIDYVNGKYYLISDDKNKPIRFYEMDLTFDVNSFSKLKITNMIPIKGIDYIVDPEALRFDINTGNFIWTSEGSFKSEPKVFEINTKGEILKEFLLPEILNKNKGLRHNGTFEGLSMSYDANYFWIGMELPLKQDGEKPKLEIGNYPVRISKINKKTGALAFQFAYQLDAITKDSKPSNKFKLNGLPEILEIGKNQFLFIERAFSAGHDDGGNTIKIYKVDCSKATNIAKIISLKSTDYMPAKKTLLFNFESIRSKLTNGIIDNIEGVTFGPTLKNGHKTLVLVSDNNFTKFSKQLNQVIVLELLTD